METESPTERSRTWETASAAVAALLAVLLVHGGDWTRPLSGLDRARIAAVSPATGDRPGIEDEGFLGRDATLLIFRMERAICGGSDKAYVALGLLFVAAAATTIAIGIARTLPARPFVAAAAAALFAGAPQWSGAGVAGHVHAIAWLFFGLLLAVRPARFGFAVKLVGALILTPAFAHSIGPLFLIVPFIPQHDTVYHARTAMKPARYLAAGLAFVAATTWILGGPYLALRNGVDTSIGAIADHTRRMASITVMPFFADTASLRTRIGGGLFVLCGLGAVVLAGQSLATNRRSIWTIGLSAIGATAFVFLQPSPTARRPDAWIGLGAAFFFSLVFATALARSARKSTRESIACGLIFAWLALAFVAARDQRREGPGADGLAEVEQIRTHLGRIENVDAVILFAAPNDPAAIFPASWIKASQVPPFGSGGFDLEVIGRDRVSDRIGPLFRNDRRTMLAEWKPLMPGATARDKHWSIAPFLGVDRGTLTEKIELVAPLDRAYGRTARPTTIDDDMTFVFAIDPAVLADDDTAIVFYSYWDGGAKPRGRQELTSRILTRAVLSERPRADGKIEFRWRTSVRPGEGHDGVPFDDPDLELLGKTMLWTIGIVHGHGLKDACPDGHDHGHDHHHDDGKKEKPVGARAHDSDDAAASEAPAHPDRRMPTMSNDPKVDHHRHDAATTDIRRPSLIVPYFRLNFATNTEISRKLH